jgi:hypothetical protein
MNMRFRILSIFFLFFVISYGFTESSAHVTAKEYVNNGTIVADNNIITLTDSKGAKDSIYGAAAYTSSDTVNNKADGARLTNNGLITVNLSKYDLNSFTSPVYAYGMTSGTNSDLINNGTIELVFGGYDKDNWQQRFGYALQGGEGSKMINNGTMRLTGTGSYGTNVRGMTAPEGAANITIKNTGLLYIDVERSYMMRGMATTGKNANITNSGTLFVRSNGSVLGIDYKAFNGNSCENTGFITAMSSGELCQRMSGALAPRLPQACAINAIFRKDTGFVDNRGLLRAYIQGNSANPLAAAAAIVVDQRNVNSTGAINIQNTGLIDVSSSVRPCSENGNIKRAAEIGINYYCFSSDPQNGTRGTILKEYVKLSDFTTTLRDFAATKDFIQAYKAEIDLSGTNLILRPASNYTAETSYNVSAGTLVTEVDPIYITVTEKDSIRNTGIEMDNVTDNEVTVTGLGSMRINSALPDFVSVRSVANGSGDGTSYSVSLALNTNSGSAEKLIKASSMLPIDFVRINMDMLDRELEPKDRIDRKVYITPFTSILKRKNGTGALIYGGMLGFDWGFGDLLTAGVHGNCAQAKAEEGEFEADSKLTGLSLGVHTVFVPVETWWVRAQGSFFRNIGDASYAMKEATGNKLSGSSSNDANGLYFSIFGGKAFEIAPQNELRPELGLSYMQFFDAPSIEWTYMDCHIAGYDMEMSKYKALHGSMKLGFIHDFAENKDGGSLYAGAGLRVRLYAPEVKLTMMNDEFDDGGAENFVQGMCEVSYRHRINKLFLEAGYKGVFGADTSNHELHITGKFIL